MIPTKFVLVRLAWLHNVSKDRSSIQLTQTSIVDPVCMYVVEGTCSNVDTKDHDQQSVHGAIE